MAWDNRGPVAGLLAIVLLASAACSPPQQEDEGPQRTVSAAVPEPALDTPATTAGPLSAADLPVPQTLGPGWKYRVEGASQEEDSGNGTPFQERDPAEVQAALVPLGCRQRSASPLASHVIQATYVNRDGEFAVGLRLRFPSDRAASRFASVRATDLLACLHEPPDEISGAATPVLAVSVEGAQTAAAYSAGGQSGRWTSGLRVEGKDVLSLDTDAAERAINWANLGFRH